MTKKSSQFSWLFAIIVMAIFAIVIFFFVRGLNKDPTQLPSVLTGKPLPTFSLPSLLNDATIADTDLPQGAFLLNVWGSWCGACYQEHPFLMELQQTVPIIGLNWPADNPNEMTDGREFLTELGNPYQLVMTDPQGSLITDLGVYGAPETFLISADHQILHRHAGAMNASVWQTEFLPLIEYQDHQP